MQLPRKREHLGFSCGVAPLNHQEIATTNTRIVLCAAICRVLGHHLGANALLENFENRPISLPLNRSCDTMVVVFTSLFQHRMQLAIPSTIVAVTAILSAPLFAADTESSQNVVTAYSDSIQVIQLERPGKQFAYDPFNSRLAVIEAEGDLVSFYAVGEKIELLDTKQGPSAARSVCFKRYAGKSYFAIGGLNDRNILVFSAETNKLVGTIALRPPKNYELAASRWEGDPYIYYSSMIKAGEWERSYYGRISLEDMKDHGAVGDGSGAIGESTSDLAISADGSILYSRDPTNRSTDMEAYRFIVRPYPQWDSQDLQTREDYADRPFGEAEYAPDIPAISSADDETIPPTLVSRYTVQLITDKDVNVAAFVPGPHGAYLAAGASLYSASLKKKYGDCSFPIDCFVPNTPWILGIEERYLHIGSLNDLRTVKRIPLPKFFHDPEVRHNGPRSSKERAKALRRVRRPPAHIFYDSSGDRILAAKGDQLVMLDLERDQLPDEPRLAIGLSGSGVIAPHTESIPLETFDERVESRLVSPPKGFTLEKNELKLSPEAKRTLGRLEVELKFERTYGEKKLEQTIPFQIDREVLILPFVAKHLRLSHDGKLAVVLGKPLDRKSFDEAEGTTLALIDTANRKLMRSKHVKQELMMAMIHEKSVYALSKGSSPKLFEYNLDQLSPVRNVDVQGEQKVLELVRHDTIHAGGTSFQLPELASIQAREKTSSEDRNNQAELGEFGGNLGRGYGGEFGRDLGMGFDRQSGRNQNRSSRLQDIGPTRKTGDSWFANGAVWDEAFKKARFLFHTDAFLSTGIQYRETYPTPWGTDFSRTKVYTSKGNSFLSESGKYYRGFAVGVSPTIPVAFGLPEYVNSANGDNLLRMPIYSLDSGRLVQFYELRDTVVHRSSDDAYLDAAGDVLAACALDGVQILHREDIAEAALDEPFRFKLDRVGIELPFRRKNTIKYGLAGGKAPYQLELSIEQVEGSASSKETATFKIDCDEIASRMLSQISQLTWPSTSLDDPRDRVLEYIDAVTPAYRNLTGRKPKGVPVAINAKVQATDATGKEIHLWHQFLMVIPSVKVVEAFGRPSTSQKRAVASRTAPPNSTEKSKSKVKTEQRRRRSEQARQLDLEMAVAYSDRFREEHPPKEFALEELDKRATEARKAFLDSLQPEIEAAQAVLAGQVRSWSDRKGHKTKASLKSAFAGQVVLRLTTGNEVSLPMERLSEQDLQFIKMTNQDIELGGDQYAELQTILLLRSIAKHVQRTGFYPPAYLVDQNGKPLLSWRVALLPDLGGAELLRLLRLDEPWDSEHNRRLVPFMPPVYGTSSESAAKGIATLLSIQGSKTIFSDGRPLHIRELKPPADKTVILAEVRTEHGFEWTRPSDLKTSSLTDLPQIVRDRDGNVIVGFSGGMTRTIPTKTSAKHWRKAVTRTE